MVNKNTSVIVVGGLHTDIIAQGVKKILGSGELTLGKELTIGPGGKSRNIAQMIATLTNDKTVAMVGKTSMDPFGLWELPVTALKNAGVNTDFIQILSFEKTKKFPAVALIPVDIHGNNQIYVLPGINEDFSKKDIDRSLPLFETAKKNNGLLVFSLELPLETAIHSIQVANTRTLKVLLDPGGITEGENYEHLLSQKIYLIKPNEHEVKILTGITIKDFASATEGAKILLKKGIENVLITVGKNGAYFFNKKVKEHIKAPKVTETKIKDETGCGDQTIATIGAFLSEGEELHEAINLGLLAGTLQFHKTGIQPITKKELLKNR